MGINWHQDLHALLLLYHNSDRSVFIYEHMVIPTIANIANRALVSTYISQVTGNHPTSIGLIMAKHIFNPGPTQGSRFISGQGSYMHQVFPINTYNLMHQT